MSLGQLHPEKVNNIKVYESLFDKSQGADFQGLALGIAGDKTFNLLWRIQNGEVPDSLHPSVWWLLIGTNDFQRNDPHCSPEVVVLGVKRVIEELRRLRPGSTIVLNSLLPRSDSDDGTLVDAEHPKHLTVWQGILEVNKELRDYCQIFRNLYYFDATSIFIRQKNNTAKGINAEFIPNELMYDYLHPTAEGYRLWGEKIVSTLHELMDASHVSKRLPLSSLWWTRTTSTNASFLREPSS
jgi:beta-glucosidase